MLFLLISFLIIVSDQIIKYFLISYLNFGESIKGRIFDITLVKNTGTAFGLFNDQNIFFLILSAITILILFILFFKFRKDNLLFKLSFVLILSGAVSNLLDRIRFGYVVDYIDFRFWPVFNIADSAITIGTVILALAILIDNKDIKKGKMNAPDNI